VEHPGECVERVAHQCRDRFREPRCRLKGRDTIRAETSITAIADLSTTALAAAIRERAISPV